MKSIVIIGAGDLGKETVWIIEDINRIVPTYLILGFLDDDQTKIGTEFYGYKVIGCTAELDSIAVRIPICAVLAIQDGSVRKKIVEAHPKFMQWETIIHPSAVIAKSSKVGKGCIIFPQVTVSVDTKIGDFVLFYIHATVCNDCVVDNYVSLMSGVSISERAELGECCFLAAGSTVCPHIKLEREVKVAVKATARKNYTSNSTVNDLQGRFILFK